MPAFKQENRPIRISTVLGTDVLLLQGFSGQEGVSTPYSYTVDLWSEDAAIDPTRLLNTAVCITLQVPGGERPIHGRISRFTQLERQGELIGYRAEVVPWLWFLSLSSDCKIFQNLSVLEIVEQVFQAQGFSDFDVQCRRSYPTREYCVQYRETHLNFVSRLLEEEGIFYFFEHSNSKHVLVLADDNSAVKPCPGQPAARLTTTAAAWQEEDVVLSCECEDAVHTGKVTLRDYDPE